MNNYKLSEKEKQSSGNHAENLLTVDSFSADNSVKTIGRSQYRICSTDGIRLNRSWYILETYNNGTEWCQGKGFGSSTLREVINIFNHLDKEQVIIHEYFADKKTAAPMSEKKAYAYYCSAYYSGIYTIEKLKDKYDDEELHKDEWESYASVSQYAARDYESFVNMHSALKTLIDNISNGVSLAYENV